MELKHYFIPSENNGYKPWILSTQALVVFCLIIWSVRILAPATITFAENTIDPQDLMNRINAERTQRFIPALTTNSKLITAATGKAQDMLARSYFAHVDPDGNYVWPRIEAAGYKPYLTLGENLAMDFTSASAVVDAWMNSPTHRENIVNAKFEDQGLATVSGTYEPNHDTILVASLFGTLYKTSKAITPPSSTAKAKPTPPPPPAPKKPLAELNLNVTTPAPAPAPTPAPTPAPSSPLQISKDIKIGTTIVSGHALVNVDVVINGSPTLVTARLKSQSITMLAGKVQGEFVGAFTFDQNENLSAQTMTVEARNKAGDKTTQDFPVNVESAGVAGDETNVPIPISNEAEIIKVLRIIFGIFAAIYMIFLAIDAIIIHRIKIKRPGIHTNTHALVFFLLATVSIFVSWL